MTLKRRFRVLRNSASAKALLAAPLALIGTQVFAASLPANGKYVAGVGAIQNSASSLTIDQSSPHGIIDWQSFSIGAGKIVRFDNGSGATLNMVTGNDLSQIAGSLTATGSVYLVNPAGVVVTSSGRVVTEGSFSATTGNATGAIANAGSITSAGGNVTLSGGNLSDTGSVAVMRGGHIWLTGTNTADIGGTIDADNANGKGGSITAEGKTLTVSGVLTARGTTAGGSIETSGHSVDMSGARVDAGASHGKDGTWLIDPDDLTIDSSAASSIDAALDAGTNVVEKTTATGTSGFGTSSPGAGDIDIDSAITWNTTATLTLDAYHSVVFAAPITVAGAGGIVMKSGHGGGFEFDGGNIAFTDMVFGQTQGSLFIQKKTFTLANSIGQLAADIAADPGGAYALANSYNAGTDGPYATDPIPTAFTGIFDGLGNTISNLSISDSADANVGLFGDLGSGGIIRHIGLLNASIAGIARFAGTQTIGGLVGLSDGTLGQDYATGVVSSDTYAGAIVGGLVGDNGGTISSSYTTDRIIGKGKGVILGGLAGQNYGSIENAHASGVVRVYAGQQSTYAGGLVGQNGLEATIADSYASGAVGRGKNVFAGGLAATNAGMIDASYATGAVTGDAEAGGLVAANHGTITQSYATGAVSGTIAGGLAGANDDAVSASYATGSVSGEDAGGLVGDNYGTIVNSHATGNLSDTDYYAGGLVAYNFGSITDSYATGSFTSNDFSGGTEIGGLVGENWGSISGSYASGNIVAVLTAGGLVGTNEKGGTVMSSFATGGVESANNGARLGGLAGANTGRISQSYATGDVGTTPDAKSGLLGGLVGVNGSKGAIEDSYATGNVSTGDLYTTIGGLVGSNQNSAKISQSYATGLLTGGNHKARIGGLVGADSAVGGSITSSYWDTTTSGITNLGKGAGNVPYDPGITGLTTAQFQSGLPAGFDSAIWGENASINGGLPYLLAIPPA